MKIKWKKAWAVMLTVSMIMGNGAYGSHGFTAKAAAPQTDLVFYTDFENENIQGKTVKDLSGQSNDGTITGDLTFVEGLKGKAAYFNNILNEGENNDNKAATQYIDLKSGLKFGTGDFTISLWMKTEENGTNNAAIISNKDYSSGKNLGFALGNFNPGSSYDVRSNFSAIQSQRLDVTNIKTDDNYWHHVAVTYDRDGEMTVYVDGAKFSSVNMSDHKGKTVDTSYPVVIGAGGTHKNGLGKCLLDEVRIYKKALSAAEVGELYNDVAQSESVMETLMKDGLVMYSTFDSVSEGKVIDGTGRGNDGIITGDVSFVPGIKGNGVSFDNGEVSGQPNKTAIQYINYGKGSDLTFGTGNFSLSFWVKTHNHGVNNGTILSNKDYLKGANPGWAFGNYNSSEVDMRMNFTGVSGQRADVEKIGANDDRWHHIVGTVDRGQNMTVYLDGRFYSSASLSNNAGKTVDTGLDFILGADGKLQYGLKDCIVDELRVYRKVLSPSIVSKLYILEGSLAIVGEMEEKVASLKPCAEYPQAAIDAMKEEISQAKQGLPAMDTAAAAAAVEALRAKYLEFLKGAKPLASFQVVSDVHIGSSNLSETNAVNLIAGLKDMKSLDPDSIATINLGDFTQNGTADQYKGFFDIMDNNLPVDPSEVLISMGNHDVRGTKKEDWNGNKDETVESKYWPTAKALYLERNTKYMPDGSALYFDKWLGGYHFIVINTENGMKDTVYLTEDQLTWLDQTMAENADPKKPIFVMGHNPLNDTHWRSNILSGFGNQDARVKEIFSKYPQVIYMNGHIHNGFGVAEVIDRPFGTMVEIPSYNESENGVKTPGIGYHVKIYEDSVVFKARNFKTSEWLPEYDVTITLENLPTLCQRAKALNPLDYSLESYQNVEKLVTEAEKLFTTQYDQSGLTWDKVGPPSKSLFPSEVRERINQLCAELKTAMDGLQSAKKEDAAKKDVYLQSGSDGGKTPASYSNYDGAKLRVKYTNSDDQTYTRKALLTFALAGLDSSVKSASLSLQLTPPFSGNTNPAKDFISADVYQVDSAWQTDTVTWNTAPARLGKAGSITKSDISGDMVTVDVSQAVVSAIAAGKTEISFEISCPEEAHDNMIDFYSTRANGKQPPKLITRTTSPTEKPVDPAFAALREKWLLNLLGGELDASNPAVQTYIDNMDQKAEQYWTSMIKSDVPDRVNLWTDLDMSYIAGTTAEAKAHSGNVAETFYRIKDMSIAWATKGCKLYHDEELKRELIAALDYMNEKHYSSSNSQTPFFGNWWHWEIGAPIAFMDTVMIFYDDLTLNQIKSYTAAVNRFTNVCDKSSGYPGSPSMTGANLIDKGMVVTQVGIITDNGEKLEHVKKAYKTVFKYVTKGDGFYEDGSFIQHQALAYMGGYGSQLYEKLSILFSVLAGSDYELSYEDHAEQIIFDTVFEGIEPFIYDGLCMDMVSGRDITRNTSNDKERGARIMDAMMLIGDAMPAKQQERYNSMIKYLVGMDEDYYYSHSTHIASLMKASRIMEDPSVVPRSEYALHKLFASMDKLVHIVPGFGFGLSMHSSRTYGHELINEEGKRTWNISDGMTYLYNSDRDQYGEGYWATVDPKRLSGTTAEYVNLPKGAGDRSKNVYSWVGGSNVDLYGTAGMRLKTLNGTARGGTDAKKSWFLFDDEIVALGSGITSSTGNEVETIIDNRRLRKDGGNEVTIDGEVKDIRDDSAESSSKGTDMKGTSWMHLEGNVSGSDIGYYFPENSDITVLKEKRTGNWSDQGTTSGQETNCFATFWFRHGKKPVNAKYSYVILPGMDAGQVQSYANAPDIEVLECSEDAHAVRDKELRVTAVNFWSDKEKTSGGITANKAASVTMEVSGGVMAVGVADPTQENSGTITVTLPYTGTEIVEKDGNVEIQETAPFVKLAVNTAGLKGKTSKAVLKVVETEQREIVGIAEEPEQITVPVGTRFSDISLPGIVKVYDNTGKTADVSVVWERSGYNKDVRGVYELKGTFELTEGLFNSAGIVPAIKVLVGNERTQAIADVYVQGGSDGDKNFAGTADLIIKYDTGAQNYTRKSLLKFDLREIPEDAEEIYLTFEMKDYPSVDFKKAEIWRVENGWKEDTVTFNSFPARIGQEPTFILTEEMAKKGLVQKLDVTEAVGKAIKEGEEELSFEISVPTAAKNNYLGIHSTESTKEGIVKPSLTWEKEYKPEKIVKKNLQFVVDMAKEIDASEFKNVDEERLQALIADAGRVLADEDASMEEIHECERLLTQEMVKYRR